MLPRIGQKGAERRVAGISWFVYVLQCSDLSLYTGVTNDLERRLGEHQSGSGCKYTRGRTPVELIASKRLDTRAEAQVLEHRLKKMKRQQKLQFISSWPANG